VLTGAGISAESGLPTFRGTGGLWRTRRVEELASPQGFERDPQLVWEWYDERRAAHAGARPNAGHLALASFERKHPGFLLATQNVDSLHLRAGSKNVVELHGSLREARCNGCGDRVPLGSGRFAAIDHRCGGRFRPDIVWFGEALPREAWERAAEAAARAEVVLVVGTSAVVYPAAALAGRYAGAAYRIEVNPEPSAISDDLDVSIRGTAAEVLPKLLGTSPG
jgi:NAD-dependent deacetylase